MALAVCVCVSVLGLFGIHFECLAFCGKIWIFKFANKLSIYWTFPLKRIVKWGWEDGWWHFGRIQILNIFLFRFSSFKKGNGVSSQILLLFGSRSYHRIPLQLAQHRINCANVFPSNRFSPGPLNCFVYHYRWRCAPRNSLRRGRTWDERLAH